MGYFVDIPKPKAWPPPKDVERVNELLAYGYKRDPIGDKLHTWFACLFMFCIPLDTAPTSISMALLFGYSLIRLPSTWRTLTPICKSTIFRMMFAWVAWSLISIIWSTNQSAGMDHAWALRMILVPVVLWPVMRHWKYFLLAFLVGVFFQNMVQVSELLSLIFSGKDWLTGGKLENFSGFEKHTGKAAMFMGFASLAWFAIAVAEKKYRKYAFPCMLVATAGMFSTVSMAVIGGFFVALFGLCCVAIAHKKVGLKHLLLVTAGLLVIASFAWFTVGGKVTTKTESAIQGVQDFYAGNVQGGNSTIMRLHWWSEALTQSFDEPAILHGVFGHGLGSVSNIDFSKDDSSMPSTTDHSHNSYIQLLYEEGIVGLLLFLFIFWKMIRTSKNLLSDDNWAIYPICVLGTLFWAIVTFFDNSQSSGRPLAMLILLATFIVYSSCSEQGEKQP